MHNLTSRGGDINIHFNDTSERFNGREIRPE